MVRLPQRRAHVLAWLGGIAAPAVATGVSLLLDGALSLVGLSMVYMAAVALSSLLPRAPAVVGAVLSVAALNFFFVPPRGSLNVGAPESWWVLAALLGLALGLHALLASLRARQAEAERGRKQACEQHELAEAMTGVAEPDAMADAAARFLTQAIGRPTCLVLREQPGPALRCFGAAEPFDSGAAAWALDNGRPLGAGALDWPELPLWCAPFSRAPAAGAVQVLMGTGQRVPSEDAAHWLALVRQAGLAIERERAARDAARAERSANAEAARNTLLASLSHDLRTPLAGIVGAASALRTQSASLGEAQRDVLLASLEDEARDMAQLADNVLQLARLSQPQAAPAVEWESLEDILGAAVARMRRRWPAASIQLRAPHGLPPVRVEAGLLAQAVANLVDNAVRHGGAPARVVLQAGRSREGVFVAVRDHGCGFSEGDPGELFSRWRRGQVSPAGGTGLGLAICQLAAQVHGGSVSARRCDPGAEFRIDLPAAPAPVEPA